MVITPFTPSSGGNNSQQQNSQPSTGVIQPYSSQPGFQERSTFNPTPTQTPAPTQQPTNNNILQTVEKGVGNAFANIGSGISNTEGVINKGLQIFNNLPGVQQARAAVKDAFNKFVTITPGVSGQNIGDTVIEGLKNFNPLGATQYAPAKDNQPGNITELKGVQNQIENGLGWYSDLYKSSINAAQQIVTMPLQIGQKIAYTAGADVGKPLPQSMPPTDLTQKIASGVTQAVTNIYMINSISNVFAKLAYGNTTVQSILADYPKLKFLPGFLSSVLGFEANSQLDPQTKDHFRQFLVDITSAGFMQGTGSIPDIKAGALKIPAFLLSSPLNFTFGFGLAKLYHASNQDALIAGGILAGLDVSSRMSEALFASRMQNGTLHMTPEEAMDNIPGGQLQNTPIGKDLLKYALEAKANGQELDLILNTSKESAANEFLGKEYRGVGYTIRLTDVVPAEPSVTDQIKGALSDERGSVSIGGMINGDKPLLSLEQEAAKEAYMHGDKEAVNTIQSAGEHMSGGVEAVHANYEDAVQAGDYDLARELAQQAAKAGDTTLLKLAGDLSPEAYKEPANIGNSNEAGGIDFFAKVEMPAITKEIHGFTSQIPEEELNKDAGGLVENPQIIAGILDDTVTQEQVAEALKGIPPIVITLGNTSVVQTPTNEQLRVDVVSPELQSLQEQLNIPQTPENQPSIAIANLLPNAGQQYAQSTALAGLPVTLPQITFNTQSGKQITVPLSTATTAIPPAANKPTALTEQNINETALPSKGLSPTNGKQTTDQNPFIQPPTKGGNAPAFSVPLRKGGNETGIIKEAIKTGQRETALKLYNGYRIKGRYLPTFPVLHQEALTEMKTTNQRLQGIKSFITTQMQHAPGAKQLMEATQTLQNHYKEVYAPSDERPRHMEYHAAKGEVTNFYPESEEIVTKLTDAKSFADFTHQTADLAKKYGGAFTELYDKIESGIITKEEYDNFKTYYQSIQTENNASEGIPASDQSKTLATSQASGQSVQPAENRQSVQGGAHAEQEPESPARSNPSTSNDQAGENRKPVINESTKPESAGPATANRSGNGTLSTESVERPASTAGGNRELTTSNQDFRDRLKATEEMKKELQDNGYYLKTSPNATVTIYHGASDSRYDTIMQTGKIEPDTFFSHAKTKSAFGSAGASDYGKVLSIEVDPRDISFNRGTGEIEASKGLVRGEDNIWRAPGKELTLKPAEAFKVGDVLDPQGKTNMVGKVTIREITGNTLKFTDSQGTEFYGMQRSVVKDLIKGGSWKRVEQSKSKVANNELTLKPAEEEGLTKPRITKTDIKTLIINNAEFKARPVLTVELGSDGKYLAFNGDKTHFNISTEALGLNGEKLEVGDKVTVDPDSLKGTVKQMRVYSGNSVYASPNASPIGSYEKVPEAKSEANNFKLFKEVEGLIDKYAQSIGEGYLPRNARGAYFKDTKNIRINGMNNLSTASHEITHFLDMKDAISKRIMEVTGTTRDGKPIYSDKSKPLRKEMTELYTKYYGGGKKTHALEKRVTEGFATLLQKYIEMPSTIAGEFPNLVKSFLQPEGQYYRPVMGEIIHDLQNIVSKYQGLDALDKVGSRVTSEKNPVQKDSYFNFRDKLRNTFLDSIWNFEKLSNLAGKGRTIDDPSMWMRFAPNHAAIFGNNISSNKGYFAYRDGEFRQVSDKNWNTLIKGLDKEKQLDSFGYYLVARDQYFNWSQLDALKQTLLEKVAAVQELKQSAGDTPLSEIEGAKELIKEADQARKDYMNQKKVLDNNGFTRKEIEDAYNQNNTRWPKEEKLFDTLTAEMLKLANHPDVMLLSPDQYKQLSSKEGYASMKRQIYDELVGDKEIPSQLNVGKTKVSSFIQRRGGTNTIINPLYNALTNEAEILKKSLTQIVYNKMGIIAKEANFPDLFQPQQVRTAVDNTGRISFPQERDNNIIMARDNYKRYPVLTDNKIKSAVDDLLTYQHMHLVDQLLVGSNRFFTHGTTALYTQFALTNFIRHQVDASAQSQNGYIPLVAPMRTLTDILARRNSQEAKWGLEYITLGGMKQTLAGWQDQSPAELMKTITNEKNGLLKAIDLLDRGMNILAVPAKYTELVTRMGEYISSRKNGNPQVVALEDAGRVTAPFHHIGQLGGKRGQMFVKSIPFFNADLQYMDQALRSLANPKTRGRYIFMTALVIASMVAAGQYLLHFGSKDQKQTYKDLQPNDLARYIWLPSPDGKTLIKFPMPQQMTPIGTMINMLLSQQFERANYSIPDFLQGAGVFLPNPLNVTDFGHFITTYMPQFIKPAFEVAANVRDYPQFMPLVSQSLQGLPPPLQYNKGTSPLAIKLGQMLNLSPIKIDYLILGYLGRAAGYVSGRPANFNPVGGITQSQYFEGGRTIQNFYNAKQTNDQLYSAAHRGITKLGSQKDTVIRNHQYDLLIGRYLTAYGKLDINADPQKASKMRDQILQLIDKRNK